jgi:hypothetical protein
MAAGVECTGHGSVSHPCPLHEPDEYARFKAKKTEELIAKVGTYEPVPVPPSSGNGWQDSSRADLWGRPPRGNQLLARQWSDGQCLQACLASILNTTPERVPDPEVSYVEESEDWHDHYNEQLAKATGHRLEFLPVSLCPPRDANRLWIAGLHEQGDRDGHAVVVRGAFVVHDPAGIYLGSLPLDRIIDGMLVVPTRRVVPVLSPMGNGYAVVAA